MHIPENHTCLLESSKFQCKSLQNESPCRLNTGMATILTVPSPYKSPLTNINTQTKLPDKHAQLPVYTLLATHT